MSSPYRTGAVVGPAGSSIPEGNVTLTPAEYQLVIDYLPFPPAKIYEPMMIGGELVTVELGDCLVEWGGEYAT